MRRIRYPDRRELDAWRNARCLPPWTPEMYPDLGVIEPGVGAVFLYGAEGGLGLVEGLITNPEASPEARHQAFLDGWRMLEAEARAAGVRRLIAITENFASTKRAVDLACMNVQPGVLVLHKDLK